MFYHDHMEKLYILIFYINKKLNINESLLYIISNKKSTGKVFRIIYLNIFEIGI